MNHPEMLREVGLVPTIQRLAILDWLSGTKQHPTADQVLSAVRGKFPSISRATVYNTLDALTRAGMVLRLTVEPSVARYDADLEPHAHFRCRICETVYDIETTGGRAIDVSADGHLVEAIRTYAYGVCASCRSSTGETLGEEDTGGESERSDPANDPSAPSANRRERAGQTKEPQAPSTATSSEKSNQKKPQASSSVPPRPIGKEERSA